LNQEVQVTGAGFTCNSYCMRVVFMAIIGFCLKGKIRVASAVAQKLVD